MQQVYGAHMKSNISYNKNEKYLGIFDFPDIFVYYVHRCKRKLHENKGIELGGIK
jgi:hypothetical protein